MLTRRIRLTVCLFVITQLFNVPSLRAQTRLSVTSPKQQFGHDIGEDYFLVNYTQYEAYLKKLDQESDRMTVTPMGRSEEGRTMYLAVITSPENQKNLARYKDISRRLALAEGLDDAQARQLASQGKAVVWIDGGLHATEVLGAQQLIQCIYDLVSRTDAETLRILNDDIVLAVLVNPDGMELVSNWYMREPDPTKRSTNGVPVLYNKYAGHDDNRDSFMVNLSETDAINRVMFREWFPQIMYNHHQTGPAGTVMFSPPFRDPLSFFYDPLMISELDEVSSAIHSRMLAENKPGVTMRSGSNYSTWYNGGLRTTAHFHNMVGILTETIGNPTPMEIPLVFRNQLPRQDLPAPIAPQVWHFKQSIDYSMTANYAVLDIASRKRDEFLYNIYVMGRNGIERGQRDNWSVSPHRLSEIEKAAAADRPPNGQRGGGGLTGAQAQKYLAMMRDPTKRDPRGYIIPSDQPDFLTAIKFANILIKNGITVQMARSAFTVSGKTYPSGSLVVFTAQAFRPHLLDMFEPQDHPDDFAYPGAPPTPPYDIAGWTPAYTMGVKFDRILNGFECPCDWHSDELKPAPGKVTTLVNAAGYLWSHQTNDSFVAVNRLLASDEDVYWMKKPFSANGKAWPAGTNFIPAKSTTLAKLQKLATEVGLNFEAVAAKPSGEALMLRKLRVGLVDKYGGSMPSGWIRQQLERFEFSFQQVFPPTLDAGNLASKFDVLIFADDALRGGTAPPNVPAEYQNRVGSIGTASTIPQIREFIEAGGTVLAIGGATNLGYLLNLPIENALTEKSPDGTSRNLPSSKFYVPGSVLRAAVDATNPLAFGMPDHVDYFFDGSPAFTLKSDAAAKGVKAVSWFDSNTPLRSGWAWGQSYLQNSAAAVEAQVGKGKIFLFGPEITFRGQPHGTFKLLFNGIYSGRSEIVTLSQ
jgi:Zinc carboxypeptidase